MATNQYKLLLDKLKPCISGLQYNIQCIEDQTVLIGKNDKKQQMKLFTLESQSEEQQKQPK